MSSLKVDWCSHEAAKYAVENWHYSKRMPACKLAKIGVWENEAFIGAVIFGVGANAHIGSPYGLQCTEVCELVRVALKKHEAPVSQIVALAVRMVKRQYPGLRLIVSYADPAEGHAGGIYQAGNWVYAGRTETDRFPVLEGRVVHPRTVSSRIEKGHNIDRSKLEYVKKPGKHKYLMPLDKQMRNSLKKISKPYPKKSGRSIGGDAPAVHAGEGGSTPVRPLQVKEE